MNKSLRAVEMYNHFYRRKSQLGRDHSLPFDPAPTDRSPRASSISMDRTFYPSIIRPVKGVYLQKLNLSGSEWDTQQSTILLDACSDTLEDIDVSPTIVRGTSHFHFCCATGARLKPVSHLGDSPASSIDFLKATKLKNVSLRCGTSSIVWITMALNTITLEHKYLREISIHIYFGSIPSFICSPTNPE